MELIFGISGLLLGGFFGAFGMAVLSGRSYDKGKVDALRAAGDVYNSGYDHGYDNGGRDGYHQAYLDQSTADEVIFTSKTDNEGD